jgi:hypothetical protein
MFFIVLYKFEKYLVNHAYNVTRETSTSSCNPCNIFRIFYIGKHCCSQNSDLRPNQTTKSIFKRLATVSAHIWLQLMPISSKDKKPNTIMLTLEIFYKTMQVCINLFIASGVGLSPLYCSHFWPIVQAPDDI